MYINCKRCKMSRPSRRLLLLLCVTAALFAPQVTGGGCGVSTEVQSICIPAMHTGMPGAGVCIECRQVISVAKHLINAKDD